MSLKIIGGIYKNTKIIITRKISQTKATSHRARKGIVSAVAAGISAGEAQNNPHSEGSSARIKILDAFAGTGCVGLEFLSRIEGSSCTFIDDDMDCIHGIRNNCKKLNLPLTKARIIKNNIFRYCKGDPDKFHIIFADPPYAGINYGKLLLNLQQILLKDGVIILETHAKTDITIENRDVEIKAYGNSKFYIIKEI